MTCQISASKMHRSSLALCAALALSACGGSESSMEPEGIPQISGSHVSNSGDNVARAGGTGTAASVGFSSVRFPGSKAGVGAPNTSIGNPGAAVPTGLTGVAAPSAVRSLTYNTSNGAIGVQSGTYNSASLQVTTGGNAYDIASSGTRFTGNVISGGRSMTVVQVTDPAAMPAAGFASYQGSGDVVYVDQPTGQAFNGTMKAKVSANFAAGTVSILMSEPNGDIGGRAYAHGGWIEIDRLAIAGNEFASSAATTGRVTGFAGATGLNSGNQRVTARGLFGGPAHDETSAVARIVDAGRGEAILRLNASR